LAKEPKPAAAAASAPGGQHKGERPEKEKVEKKKKKRSGPVHEGIAVISASFNNTIVTLTDLKGNVLAWSTSGSLGFRGAKKSTPFASQLVAEDAANKARERYQLRTVHVRVKGPGSGREAAIRALQNAGLNVLTLKDTTPIPHNGCRPRKRRRV
jgi:small subunit ribosomal protein S11